MSPRFSQEEDSSAQAHFTFKYSAVSCFKTKYYQTPFSFRFDGGSFKISEKSTGVLGTGDATEMDESSEKFQRGGGGGVNFQSKTLLNFGP